MSAPLPAVRMPDTSAEPAGTPGDITDNIRDGLLVLQRFTSRPAFQALLQELWDQPLALRHEFVSNVILNPAELRDRDIIVPDDIRIMRSSFRDDRPTLFCIVRYVREGLGWSKVTITFDNPSGDPAFRYAAIRQAFNGEAARGQHH
ncbi:hypothetical protein SAMN05428950_104157 [Sphingomonas sp. OV641]|uniref:hypothetical protein n=1 Tax=unclassified Sphingomonas TaxID=196159 RepID=UPI0008344378|nr:MULTISPECIES: hypothetical protein [unclassified Sphingomonas]SEJ88622.1 hypothetical protein SAMN05428950_104157 [Sphingomonas sp. OV641]